MAERKPAAAGAVRCSCTALRKATRRISLLYDMVLAPSGLKTSQYSLLAHVGRLQPATVGQLAEALVMDSGALAHTLKPLERDGLVAIAVDPEDRRARLISLTRQGRDKVGQTAALLERAQKGFTAAFGGVESETLRRALQVLISDDFAARFEKAISAPAG